MGKARFSISSKDRSAFNAKLVNFGLHYMPDELVLLDPIKTMIEQNQYSNASVFGFWSSSRYLHMGNHFVRVLNGLYTLKALDSARNDIGFSKDKNSYDFMEYSTYINNLGWSLFSLNDKQFCKLIAYLERNVDIDYLSILSKKEQSNRLIAKENLNRIYIKLIDEKRFNTLICQCLRHLLVSNRISLNNY